MNAGSIAGAVSPAQVGADLASTGSLVAIGNFDGVHRGHQAILRAAVETALERGLTPLVLTFHPHPAEVLGRRAPERLTTLERKVALLRGLAEPLRVVVAPFTSQLASMTPAGFAEALLREQLRARAVVVGENFRFGARRAGTIETLKGLGERLGFEVMAQALRADGLGAFSSTRIRSALAAGNVAAAAEALGRPHGLTGTVVAGDQRGRTIGFPTANLADLAEAVPAHGVYVARVVDVDREATLASAVVNIGVRPTVAAGYSVEAHLLDFGGDLYGHRLRVEFLRHLRGERKFDGLPALVAQIEQDVAQARSWLESSGASPAP